MAVAILGNKIAVLRKRRGVTQQELADAIGLKRTSLSQIETGAYGASDGTKKRISDFFDLPVGEIFYNRDVSKFDESVKKPAQV